MLSEHSEPCSIGNQRCRSISLDNLIAFIHHQQVAHMLLACITHRQCPNMLYRPLAGGKGARTVEN